MNVMNLVMQSYCVRRAMGSNTMPKSKLKKIRMQQLASNVDKAIVMLIKEIFNESIWADLNKGTTIGSSSLRNRHSVQQI
jgi:porphobilinogen deaminase